MPRIKLKLFLRFLKLVLPYRRQWLLILILSGLAGLLDLVNPYLSKLVIDKAIGNKDLKLFIILALAGGSVFILGALMDALRQFLDRYIKIKVDFNLNKKVYQKIQNLSLAYFKEKSTGEHLYKINYDVERVKDFITTVPPQGLSIFPRLLFTLVIVFYLNWKMAVFSLFLAPFLYLPSYYFTKRMRAVWNTLIEGYQDIFKNLDEVFSHIQLVKAFGKEAGSVRKHLRKLIANIRLGLKNIRLEIASAFISGILSKIIVGLISAYGIYQVIKGQMTLGTFTAIMVYLTQLMGLQGQFAYFFQMATLGLVSCERIEAILDEALEIKEAKEAKSVSLENPSIIFKDISFGYRRGEFILKNLSFGIEDKKHIALAGPSGQGKTTILNLILRLYDPWQGEVLVNGYNIRLFKLSSLRGQIAVAMQEPFLWNDTIENNIRYGREKATQEEIIRVAQITGVDEMVRDLPSGYAAVIGENACKLSEGQKQRIAIARALIKTPKILILDEATSSMDSESEERIITGIKERYPELLLITASHRLSTVMQADLVYYLRGPDTIVIDTASNLLDTHQDFADLFATQSKICV